MLGSVKHLSHIDRESQHCTLGANIINYGLFIVIYGTQFSCEQFTGKSTEIYNLYVLKKSVKTSVNVDNIGPRGQYYQNL
jgi:hypothetical protein